MSQLCEAYADNFIRSILLDKVEVLGAGGGNHLSEDNTSV